MTAVNEDHNHEEFIDERIERLRTERYQRTSSLFYGRKEDFMDVWRQLSFHAETTILNECSKANKERVNLDYMEWVILKTYMEYFGWHPYFERRFSRRGQIRWVNAIAWARERLVTSEFLMDKDKVPNGDYLLVVDAEKAEQRRLRQQKTLIELSMKDKSLNVEISKRKRIEFEVRDPDAVYIIVDPRHPNCCKIGAGNGDCRARERVAKLWTNEAAELMLAEPVGAGRGFRIEWEARGELQRKFGGRGEWVECNYLNAIPILKDWAEKSRQNKLPGSTS